jgi:hypothetical protein
LEYLLMIAGGVLLSAVMVDVVNSNMGLAAGQFNAGEYSSRIQNYLSSGPSGSDDGDWVIVGNDQYSGVPGNVGIGITNPGAKLEVNGDSKFGGEMNLSDNRITGLAAPVDASDAANKQYVDAAGTNYLYRRYYSNCSYVKNGGGEVASMTCNTSICALPAPAACPAGWSEVAYGDDTTVESGLAAATVVGFPLMFGPKFNAIGANSLRDCARGFSNGNAHLAITMNWGGAEGELAFADTNTPYGNYGFGELRVAYRICQKAA